MDYCDWSSDVCSSDLADRLAAQLPRSNALFQRSIVEIARLTKLVRQGLGLLPIRVDPVFEGNTHSHTFLLRNVLLNGGCSYRTYGTREITTTPESRKTASQPREFLTKNPATGSLEPVHNLSHTVGRVVLNKEVEVIRHDFHCMQRETVLSGLFVQDPLQWLIDTVDQHGATILWIPYSMYLQCENRTGVLCIPFHVILIHPSNKYYIRSMRFRCQLKPAVPSHKVLWRYKQHLSRRWRRLARPLRSSPESRCSRRTSLPMP